MQSIVLVSVFCLVTISLGYPQYKLMQNENGEIFKLQSINRAKRQSGVYGKADNTDPGRFIVGARGTPINNANHRLDTHVFATDNLRHHSPFTVGGEANYLHKPTKSTFDVSAVHTERFGTDLRAGGSYNFYNGRRSNANLQGYVSRHIGGLPGTGPWNHGIMLNYKRTF